MLGGGWEYHTAGANMFRRLLKHLDGNFTVHILRENTGEGAVLDLMLVNSKVSRAKQLSTLLATVSMKLLNLKSLVTGGKVAAILQPWAPDKETSGCSTN